MPTLRPGVPGLNACCIQVRIIDIRARCGLANNAHAQGVQIGGFAIARERRRFSQIPTYVLLSEIQQEALWWSWNGLRKDTSALD